MPADSLALTTSFSTTMCRLGGRFPDGRPPLAQLTPVEHLADTMSRGGVPEGELPVCEHGTHVCIAVDEIDAVQALAVSMNATRMRQAWAVAMAGDAGFRARPESREVP